MSKLQTGRINLTRIIKEYGTKISALSNRMIMKREIAEEASQEVWFQILKSIDNFKGNSSISTWIYTIARRTILRYSNNEKVHSLKFISKMFNGKELKYTGDDKNREEWMKNQCDSCLSGVIHCLDNDTRLIFTLKFIIDLSYSKISKIMELTEENVRKIISRSRKKIQNFMSDNCILFNPSGSCRCRGVNTVKSVNYYKEYEKLKNIKNLTDFYLKFENDLPRKNFFEKFYNEDVTK